jgi:hypothetical protein
MEWHMRTVIASVLNFCTEQRNTRAKLAYATQRRLQLKYPSAFRCFTQPAERQHSDAVFYVSSWVVTNVSEKHTASIFTATLKMESAGNSRIYRPLFYTKARQHYRPSVTE